MGATKVSTSLTDNESLKSSSSSTIPSPSERLRPSRKPRAGIKASEVRVSIKVDTVQTACPCCGNILNVRLPFIHEDKLYYEQFVTHLTPLECRFMKALITERLRGGLFITKDKMLSEMYVNQGLDEPETSYKALDVIIFRLREALEFWPITIVTNWGQGYALHFRGE